MKNYMTEGILYLLLRQGQKRDKKLVGPLILARLLALLSFAGLLCFCLLEVSALGLTIGLAIDGAKSMSREIVVGFSGWLR